eukprot:8567181-Pyramimonas_sp.AAC.1
MECDTIVTPAVFVPRLEHPWSSRPLRLQSGRWRCGPSNPCGVRQLAMREAPVWTLLIGRAGGVARERRRALALACEAVACAVTTQVRVLPFTAVSMNSPPAPMDSPL